MARVRGIPKNIAKLMDAYGFCLIRATNHLIWHHPTGARVVTSVTPRSGDTDKVRRDIRHALAAATSRTGLQVHSHD